MRVRGDAALRSEPAELRPDSDLVGVDDALVVKAAHVQSTLAVSAEALSDARRSLGELVRRKASLPPALAAAWRERGLSREEEAYLKARETPLTPETRLRRDLLRAGGWSVAALPFDHWIGLPSDALRRAYLAFLLPPNLRRRRQ